MSLVLQGKIINTFKSNSGKDPETGAIREGKDKIQVMSSMPMESGENRLELIDLSCNDLAAFKPFLNKNVSFPVGVTAMGGNAYLYVPKGSVPTELKGQVQ
jgi:hypothetical protein